MIDTFDTPDVKVRRDRFGRPYIVPPGGGKPVPYTRCTTFVDALDDKYNLGRWQQRMVAIGLCDRPDLLLAVAAHRDDKTELNKITEKALDAAQAGAAATVGTALHALTDRIDQGLPLGVIPEAYRADLDAYEQAMADIEVIEIEQFVVLDELKIAGTRDRILRYQGGYYVGDTKSGSIEWGGLKIAQQEAVYAHATPYDAATDTRIDQPYTVDTEWALVVHLPAGQGKCEKHWVNIAVGWAAVQVSAQVRAYRSRRDWYTPFEQFQPGNQARITLAQLETATTLDELRRIWVRAKAAGHWTEEHLRVALDRKQELEKGAA